MSLDTLMQEAAALDEASRRKLLTYLVSLRGEQWAEEARQAARKLDDPDQSRWLTPEEFKRRLDLIPEPADE